MKVKRVIKVQAAKSNLHLVFLRIAKKSKNQNNRTKYRTENLKMLPKVQQVLLRAIKLKLSLSVNKMKMVH